MKRIENWVVSKLGGGYVAVPSGKTAEDFGGIIRLNETAKDIFEGLIEGLTDEQIAARLVELYEGIDLQKATAVVASVVEQLKRKGVPIDEA